jgi:predicted esterase
MEQISFPTTRTGRFFRLGAVSPAVRTCWMVLHGYGQLAGRFIRRFDSVLDAQTLVVAPEALSVFYTDAGGNETGATWMTREHRLDDIADNLAYLDAVKHRAILPLHPECQLIAFAFSQGCATLMRWLLHAQPPLKALVLYAGNIPDDLPYSDHKDYLNSFTTYVTYGNSDQYLQAERLPHFREVLERSGLKIEYHVFEGGHRVSREVLAHLKNNI